MIEIQTIVKKIDIISTPIRVVEVQTIGAQGPEGVSYKESFESISKNIRTWDFIVEYNLGLLTKIKYTKGSLIIDKSFNYTSGKITSIVLSGDTPSGIQLTKAIGYTSGKVSSISYT